MSYIFAVNLELVVKKKEFRADTSISCRTKSAYRQFLLLKTLFSLQGYLELTEDNFIEISSMEIHFYVLWLYVMVMH